VARAGGPDGQAGGRVVRLVIRGVVWDLDETLIQDEAAVATAFARAAELGAARAGVPSADLAAAARRCARLAVLAGELGDGAGRG